MSGAISFQCFAAELKAVIGITVTMCCSLSSGLCHPAAGRRGKVKHGRCGRNRASSRREGDGTERTACNLVHVVLVKN